jgi:YHS domain-containing protein
MIKFILFAIALTLSTLVSNAEPPPGPRDIAKCPVTGAQFSIGKDTPRVNFKHGQELFFSSSDAAQKYFDSPRDYWLSPHELPLPGMDGKRGLPDLRNDTLYCPNSGEKMTITMKTPRVIHRYGQNLYFCCFGCLTQYWTDPSSMLVNVTKL